MIGAAHALAWLLMAMAAVGSAYAVAAGILVRRFVSATATTADSRRALSLIKPLHGLEPGLRENLESFCRQDYSGEVQILCGFQDPDDPAAAVARQFQSAHPEADIRLVVDRRLHGQNRKISNVINIAAEARHETVVLSDSDIRAPRHYLRAVAAALDEPGAGAATFLYVGEAAGGFWSRLSAMAISYHFLPNAVLGSRLGLARPCFGSTIALPVDVLGRIGGFAAFADHLADDFEIGRAVRGQGLRVVIPPSTVIHRCAESSMADLVEQELRWGLTVRRIAGAGYAGSVVTHATPLALIGLALSGFSPVALAVLAAALTARWALKVQVDTASGAPGGPWWLLPLRDSLSLVVFVASFLIGSVGWRGRRFRVRPDGALAPP